ncbi:MAG: hypothetical protein FWC69_06300 [Defluviitaleaceae bacterium]|nr:hypothetical protein [Defluviitaleaceae bacterium]
MREGFAFDRESFYGFDYDNSITTTQAEMSPIVEGIAANEAVSEMSAKEAFDEFARQPWPPVQTLPGHIPGRAPQPPRPQPQPHRPPAVQPAPMPTVPPHRPQPPRPQPPRRPSQPPRFNHHSGSAPRFAPPAYIPQLAPGLRAVDPGAISRCLYSNTYVWLSNGQGFWFFPTFIGRRSIAGFRWMHNHWVYKGFDLGMIQAFFCGGR